MKRGEYENRVGRVLTLGGKCPVLKKSIRVARFVLCFLKKDTLVSSLGLRLQICFFHEQGSGFSQMGQYR